MEGTILDLHACLNQDEITPPTEGCDYCPYISSLNAHLGQPETRGKSADVGIYLVRYRRRGSIVEACLDPG